MNYWMLASSLLMCGATGQAIFQGRYRMAVVFFSYAVANAFLMGAK